MIYTPVEICAYTDTGKEKNIKGALLEKSDLKNIINLVAKLSANGLKCREATMMMKICDAYRSLAVPMPKPSPKKVSKQPPKKPVKKTTGKCR